MTKALTGTTPSKSIVPLGDPRPSASLVVVNARNEILLVQRNPRASSFGGFHVFPGGTFDEDQDDSLAMTAIRETFEESGLLILFSASHLDEVTLNGARQAIHARRKLFRSFLAEHHLRADLSSLLPFTQWVTPIGSPRRFCTLFFVVFLLTTSGREQEREPTPDDGQEVISARFLHPMDAISEFQDGKVTFTPPQYYILSTLSSILHGNENTHKQREQVAALSSRSFGSMVINPKRMAGRDSHGRTVLTFEGDETRGGPKGQFHRMSVRWVKQKPTEMSLLRNYDIFAEIEHECRPNLVKL